MTVRSTTCAALTAMLLAATAASAQTDPKMEVAMACKGDVARLCPGVQPGGGKIKECLMAQRAQVSFGCKKALYQAKKAKDAQGAPPQ
jgi:D-serine deaminase-like pyridoxal phosphate-dependent protein